MNRFARSRRSAVALLVLSLLAWLALGPRWGP
jgi:hypothetical protein